MSDIKENEQIIKDALLTMDWTDVDKFEAGKKALKDLITELEAARKMVAAVLDKYPHDAHCDVNDLHAALFPETKKPCNCWRKHFEHYNKARGGEDE